MHGSPRLNLYGRQLLVDRVGAGWSVAAAAEAAGVSRATGHKWIRRYREEGEAGLEDRPSRPHRTPARLSAEQEAPILQLPASVAHTVVGIGFLVPLGSGTLGLSGSLLLLFLAYLVLFLPQAARSANAAFSQVGIELWESSLMCGASQLRTFLRILLPLMVPGLLAGWVIVSALVFGEVTASVFLSGTSNPVVGPLILDLWQNGGNFPQLAALATFISVVNTVVVGIVLAAGPGQR